MIVKQKTMPNGAPAMYHRVLRLEMFSDSTQAVVNSFLTPDQAVVSWQDTYSLPVSEALSSLASVENLLVSPNGPFAGGTVLDAEQSDYESQKAFMKAKLKLRRDTAEWAGVQTAVGLVDSDPDSQRKISGTVTMAMLGGENFSIEWRMKDNTVVTLNAAQTIAVGVAVGMHVAAGQVNKNRIDSLLEACTDVAQLMDIDLEEGWP